MYPSAKAHMQGVILGMHAAQNLGIKHLGYNLPSQELLRQVTYSP